jgi:GT2 family glycosyltransferase
VIPVLVPRRPDGGVRDAAWSVLQGSVWAGQPYEVVEGFHAEGPFNRSMALNAAAASAGVWEVAVVADADTWVHPGALAAAVEQAARARHMVVPHRSWRCLTPTATARVLSTRRAVPGEWHLERTGAEAVSGVLVVHREQWDAAGGFDERFVGYGWEDLAFARACVLTGGWERLAGAGACWHLHHGHDVDLNDPQVRANGRLFGVWQRAESVTDARA